MTPNSFADLPEYSPARLDRRMSAHSSSTSREANSRTELDTDTVILERFEDVVHATQPTSSTITASRRSSTVHEMQRLSLSESAPRTTMIFTRPGTRHSTRSDDHLLTLFRHYIVPRLVQPVVMGGQSTSVCRTQDIFEAEAARFPPVSLVVFVVHLSKNDY